MREAKNLEINCPACGRETLLKREPIYEGFKRTGEKLSCLSCGHVFADESKVPFKHVKTKPIFDKNEMKMPPKIFAENEAGKLCRHCAEYVVNPFIQRCALHKKTVEATDSCPDFRPRPPGKPT